MLRPSSARRRRECLLYSESYTREAFLSSSDRFLRDNEASDAAVTCERVYLVKTSSY